MLLSCSDFFNIFIFTLTDLSSIIITWLFRIRCQDCYNEIRLITETMLIETNAVIALS